MTETPRAGRDKPASASAFRKEASPDSPARGGERLHVTAATITMDGHAIAPDSFALLDFGDVVVDPGGWIFGPGPYLKVACPRDSTRHRIRPRDQSLIGRVDFVRDPESPSGWSIVKR